MLMDSVMVAVSDRLFEKDITSWSDSEVVSDCIEAKDMIEDSEIERLSSCGIPVDKTGVSDTETESENTLPRT